MTTNDLATLVLNDMVSALNNWQLAKLKKTLETVFSQIDVITKKVDEAPCTSENEQFLRAFLAAKRVEGCSDRTVSYYESTLNKALSVIGKHASLITTDDLREYLHEYPLARGASNATVDNIRRVLPTFFSWLEDEDHEVPTIVRGCK